MKPQTHNQTMAAAHVALTFLHGMKNAEILNATTTNTGHLIVATLQSPQRRHDLPYGVDVFRRPSAAETDPDQDDPWPLDSWVLVHQWGADDAVEHAQQMQAARDEYTTRIPLAA